VKERQHLATKMVAFPQDIEKVRPEWCGVKV